MSLNSYTTKENGEIGIAQMLQAEAAMVEPSVHMNPILLKPKGDFTSNVIIQGKSIGDMNFYQYQHDYHNTAFEAIQESFNILKEKYDRASITVFYIDFQKKLKIILTKTPIEIKEVEIKIPFDFEGKKFQLQSGRIISLDDYTITVEIEPRNFVLINN